MIKKRIKKSEDLVVENDKTESSDLNNNNGFKTFKDQAIHVLNILEKDGINIYDETNYGGMYLKTKNSDRKLSKIFKKENTSKVEDEVDDIFLKKLFK